MSPLKEKIKKFVETSNSPDVKVSDFIDPKLKKDDPSNKGENDQTAGNGFDQMYSDDGC